MAAATAATSAGPSGGAPRRGPAVGSPPSRQPDPGPTLPPPPNAPFSASMGWIGRRGNLESEEVPGADAAGHEPGVHEEPGPGRIADGNELLGVPSKQPPLMGIVMGIRNRTGTINTPRHARYPAGSRLRCRSRRFPLQQTAVSLDNAQ